MIFCAEIGSNHKGIPSLAFEMIRQAAQSGATIAKFQLGHSYSDRVRYIDSHAQDLKDWCDYFDIEFMASIFSMKALEIARKVEMKRYKIAHQITTDQNQSDLYNAIWRDGKPVFQSGCVSFSNVLGIWCKSEYPCYDISDMPYKFGDEWYGYSSHMHGIEDALIAVVRGAQYIEKHVTLDKTEESIKDNHFALSFDEFAEMVRLGRGIERILNG